MSKGEGIERGKFCAFFTLVFGSRGSHGGGPAKFSGASFALSFFSLVFLISLVNRNEEFP